MKYLKIAVIAVVLFGLQLAVSSRDSVIQNLFFKVRGPIKHSDNIRIAAIDDVSINVIGNWPWSRAKIAELIDSIAVCRPSVVYVNIYFRKKSLNTVSDDEAREISADNEALAAAVKRAGNVILPYLFEEFGTDTSVSLINTPEQRVYDSRFQNIVGNNEGNGIKSAMNLYYPEPVIAENALGLGLAKIAKADEAQTNLALQAVKYGRDYYPTIPLLTAAEFLNIKPSAVTLDLTANAIRLGPDIRIPLLIDGTTMINFCGAGGTFPHLSAGRIMSPNFRREQLQDKIVVVGVTDKALVRESVPSATPYDAAMVSSEVWANIIENTLGYPVSFVDASSTVFTLVLPLLLILLLCGVTLACQGRPLRVQLLILAPLGLVITASAFLLFLSGKWISVLVPLLYILFLAAYSIYRAIKSGAAGGLAATAAGKAALLQGTAEFNRTGNLVRVGRYQIVGEIGSGAMGTVYKALDPKINRTVAIKTLKNEPSLTGSREVRERFVREAQAAGTLSHPNIVTIYDCGEAENVTYIAMEYLEGKSLAEKLVEEKKLKLKDTAAIIGQIAEGLSKAHRDGIIHRDVKPANIMLLAQSNIVKIMDFGVAKICNATMTQTGKTLGTPYYMSPEQINAEEIDNRSDIFSLGVIAYECLSGRRPFSGENLSALSYSILYKKPDNITDLNTEVNPAANLVFNKVLAKDKTERYQDARDFAESLKAALV